MLVAFEMTSRLMLSGMYVSYENYRVYHVGIM
jgi:hypothetical protein